MTKLFQIIKREFLEVLPPTIFFLVTFHIVLIDRALMLHLNLARHGTRADGSGPSCATPTSRWNTTLPCD